MRHELEAILGEELRYLAIKTRAHLGFTQREMGQKLQMSESSYSDIETGKSRCSALTTMLLLDLQEDPRCFLETVYEKFNKWYEAELNAI